jgi:hypothetical protein
LFETHKTLVFKSFKKCFLLQPTAI